MSKYELELERRRAPDALEAEDDDEDELEEELDSCLRRIFLLRSPSVSSSSVSRGAWQGTRSITWPVNLLKYTWVRARF